MDGNIGNQLEGLFDEILGLAATIRKSAPGPRALPAVSLPARAVLRGLRGEPGLTVPQLARRRGTSRQNVQVLVDRLSTAGLVRYMANPDHQRSERLELTPAGERSLRSANQRQTLVLGRLSPHVTEQELASCTTVLKRLRDHLGPRGRASQPRTEPVMVRRSRPESSSSAPAVASMPVAGPVEDTTAVLSPPEDLPVSLL